VLKLFRCTLLLSQEIVWDEKTLKDLDNAVTTVMERAPDGRATPPDDNITSALKQASDGGAAAMEGLDDPAALMLEQAKDGGIMTTKAPPKKKARTASCPHQQHRQAPSAAPDAAIAHFCSLAEADAARALGLKGLNIV